jgi:hypothetical protein
MMIAMLNAPRFRAGRWSVLMLCVRGLGVRGLSGRRLMEGKDAEPFNGDD